PGNAKPNANSVRLRVELATRKATCARKGTGSRVAPAHEAASMAGIRILSDDRRIASAIALGPRRIIQHRRAQSDGYVAAPDGSIEHPPQEAEATPHHS